MRRAAGAEVGASSSTCRLFESAWSSPSLLSPKALVDPALRRVDAALMARCERRRLRSAASSAVCCRSHGKLMLASLNADDVVAVLEEPPALDTVSLDCTLGRVVASVVVADSCPSTTLCGEVAVRSETAPSGVARGGGGGGVALSLRRSCLSGTVRARRRSGIGRRNAESFDKRPATAVMRRAL